LLDFALGADARTGHVEVEVTVEAKSAEVAMAEGISWIRSAIHSTGAGTPGWEKDAPSATRMVEFRLGEATTTPLVPA
jgi:hypothetical protein